MSSPADTVRAFIQAINRHDIATITNLMTNDHEFVDSLGVAVHGKDTMRQAWIAYFFMIPDYTIDIDEMITREETVIVAGKASGTVAVRGDLPPANRWEIPMAALASVRDGSIVRWQVFADNEPVRRILNIPGQQE